MWARLRRVLHEHPEPLVVVFSALLVAWNLARLDEWGLDGFKTYFTQAIMQTTLFDFACVLVILALFIEEDAKKLGIRWVPILVTFPFMPTLGLLWYFLLRKRALRKASAAAAEATP